MKGCAIAILAFTWIWGVNALWADTQQIGLLRSQQKRLVARKDSLESQRRQVVAEAERLSGRIDRLKEEESDPEALHEALRSSLVLVQRMVDIDRRLEEVKVGQDSLQQELRLAYDWEIGILIQKLSDRPDEGLLTQLMVYQEEREALGVEPVGQGLHYGEEMAISPDDGPDEIRQKMELMEDIATRLQQEAKKTSVALDRLEEEHRLRTRVRVFTREISLFDEHLPEGRVLVRSGMASQATDEAAAPPTLGEAVLPPAGGDADASSGFRGEEIQVGGGLEEMLPAAPALQSQREVERGGRILSIEGVANEEIALEIHKLKAHQQEIRQLEEVVRERAETFRTYLERMLEGKE